MAQAHSVSAIGKKLHGSHKLHEHWGLRSEKLEATAQVKAGHDQELNDWPNRRAVIKSKCLTKATRCETED